MQIDWEEQWRIHAPDFKDGRVQRPIPGSEKSLQLLPGPGFGDCSHPTTRLMLHLMHGVVKSARILDMGCGSGVLSIAAALMGAQHVWGLDIEADAVQHAQHNAAVNDVNCEFAHVDRWDPRTSLDKVNLDLLLLNMTFGEQRLAWKQLQAFGVQFKHALISGLLVEQCPEAIQCWVNRGFAVESIKKEGEWCALSMRRARPD